MNIVNETITPAKASQYLLTSKGNRPISRPTVRSYADSMKQGKWMLNGVSIIFDTEGHLIDGHHRLNAVVEAQVPVEMTVCRGVDTKAFTTYDCGLQRRLGQLLAMQDVKNYNTCGAVVAANDILCRTGRIYANNGAAKGMRGKRTNMDAYDMYSKDAEGYQYSAAFACEMHRKANVLNASWIGGIHYYLTHTGGYEKKIVENYFNNLCSLDACGVPAIDLLRKRIIKERMAGKKGFGAEMLFALVAKSWNFYITETEVKKIAYDAEKENEYPTLKLND